MQMGATQPLARLLTRPPRLRDGFVAVLSVGVGYALTVAGIALSNGTPSAPWLPIAASDYFKWEALFIAPVTLACWVVAGCVIQLLSKPLHGTGTLKDTLARLGFAVATATMISLVPDAVRAALTTFGSLDRAAWEQAVAQPGTPDFAFLWSYMIAYLAAMLLLFPMVVAATHGLRGWPAVLVGVAAAVVYQGLYFVFVR